MQITTTTLIIETNTMIIINHFFIGAIIDIANIIEDANIGHTSDTLGEKTIP